MAWGFAVSCLYSVYLLLMYSLPSLPSKTHVAVWFSCGAASAVAAKLTLDTYPHCDVRVINNPVMEEDEDNRRFLLDVQQWLGVPIETAVNSDYADCSAETVWLDKRFMSSLYGAPCTTELKKKARQQWESIHKPDWHVLGFTSDEAARFDRFTESERPNTLPILLANGISKQSCVDYLHRHGLELPRVYKLGYPNANCIGCVKATSPTYWNLVRAVHPDVFEARAGLSRALGVRLVRHKGERVFLDELPLDAVGRPLKQPTIDCGIFCEEEAL